MSRQHRPCYISLPVPLTRIRSIVAATIVFATAGAFVLSYFSEPFLGSAFRGRHQHLAKGYRDEDNNGSAPDGDVNAISYAAGGPYTTRGSHQQEWEQRSGHDTRADALTKQYSSFAVYAHESFTRKGLPSLPVPVVKPVGQTSALSIPVITVIGVQKGGTTNLRGNLMTHPMLSGIRTEVHFFDQGPLKYPTVGQWEGDGLDHDVSIWVAGKILSAYAQLCAFKGRKGPMRYTRSFRTDGLHVDSTPQYIFNALTPYRIRMVRPWAKFVVVIRDPTDRYFSQLRMEMCRSKHLEDPIERDILYAIYHPPGGAKGYLAAAEEIYEPYTDICRGENASSSDLSDCNEALKVKNPLFRGLYADQLERWFRVFDRSQMMIIEASEMFADFTATVAAVVDFAGLPEHSFVYNAEREHASGGCEEDDRRMGLNYFAPGGRYEKMVEEAEVIREWYRPHNERLYKLLGRRFMWQ